MNTYKGVDRALKVFTAAMLVISLALTFTVSDYFIFDKFKIYNPLFIVSQWIKKAGILLLPLAVFLKKRSCADVAKYILPLFIIFSLFSYGDFFDITKLNQGGKPAQNVYASINEFMPKSVHQALFFVESELMLGACALLFVRDGLTVSAKSFRFAPIAILAVTPLNIFENFYDELLYDKQSATFRAGSTLLFKSFELWHLVVLAILVASTVGCYLFLRRKSTQKQHEYLAAIAIILLIQYHSKDSVVMGDGYNVYRTVFACIPLFICNIGVYVACLSVFLKKKILYAISFFVHSAGALSVFTYFGDGISNYGIFCGYSILFFSCTHCLLFMLSVVPSALGHYKFKPKDAIVPLIYYCLVMVVAAVVSGLITSASMEFSYGGYTLQKDEWIIPNFAFTQTCPLPIGVPNVLPITIWRYELNGLYLIILYLAYVAIFYAFNGVYYLFLAIRRRLLHLPVNTEASVPDEVQTEAAATDDEQ